MNPICTVLLITYNHAPYIRKCIESVLAQKTDFEFIIKIFDDASTDGSSDIIKEYAKKYPDLIEAHIAQENMGAQDNIWRAYESVDTKYCILTETDDYWCNENKLQMQIQALEDHPECSFCSTNNTVEVIKDDYLSFKNNQKEIKDHIYKDKKIITLEDVKNIPCGFLTHPTTRLIRTSTIDLKNIKYKEALLFDISQYFYLLHQGNMYWIDEIFSVYVKTGRGISTSANASSRMNQYWRAMLELNLQTEGRIFEKIAQQIVLVTNYWINLELKQKQQSKPAAENKPQTQTIKQPQKIIKKESKFKKLKHYIFPPIVLDLFNLPRDIIRKIKRLR